MNRGAELLAEKFKEHGDQKKLAKLVGFSQGHLSRLASGQKLPSAKARRILEDLLGIRMQRWDEPAKVKAA